MGKKLKILALHRQNSAVGYYRTWLKARSLKDMGHKVLWWERESYNTLLRPKRWRSLPRRKWSEQWFRDNLNRYDLLMVDRAVASLEWARFAAFKYYSKGCRMIVDMDDDFACIPPWNQSHKTFQPGSEPYEAALSHLKNSEMLTVSTETLRRRFEDRAHRARVLPNLIDPKDWVGHPVCPEREKDPHLRILYGGASGHYGDLDEVKQAVKSLVHNPPTPFRLICFGSVPGWIHTLGRKYPGRVVIPGAWIPFRDYPAAVAWGGFDLAIAPLADHPFNHAKSNIKWLEAGIQQIPLICSDVGPYKDIPDECAIKVENTPAQWSQALRGILDEPQIRADVANRAFEAVYDSFTIDKGQKRLQSIVEEAMAAPRIETLEDTRLPSDQSVELNQPVQ